MTGFCRRLFSAQSHVETKCSTAFSVQTLQHHRTHRLKGLLLRLDYVEVLIKEVYAVFTLTRTGTSLI